MRIVAQYGKYGRQFQARKANTDHNGVETVTQEGIYLQFQQEDMRQNEIDLAMQLFGFRGQFQAEDQFTPTDPIYRISVFDTRAQGWDDELRLRVEAWLESIEDQDPDFFIVRSTPIPRPFPNYDEYPGSAAQLIAKLREDGYDLAEVLIYEREYGLNRPKITQALEAELAHVPEGVVVA
jgi:hypothetical protein